jgi:NADH-quinone oxidoreductase subunit L
VTWPLIALAVPSLILGFFTIGPIVFSDFFAQSILVHDSHNSLKQVAINYHGAVAFIVHAFHGPAVYLSVLGVFSAWYIYIKKPYLAQWFSEKLSWLYLALVKKYGFDEFNQKVFANGSLAIGRLLWKKADKDVIDGAIVNGSSKNIAALAAVVRYIQTGYIFHYAFAMIFGMLILFTLFVFL